MLFPKITFHFQCVFVHSVKPKSIQEMYFCGFKMKLKFLIKNVQGITSTREKLIILRYAFN